MSNFKDILVNGIKNFEINLSEEDVNKFIKYKDMLKEWNEKINLTAITESESIAVKHFIDSLSVLKFCKIEKNSKLIDIGTGAGFPGVPIKIVNKEVKLTLLDSLNKRLVFLNELVKELGLNAEIIHSRAEDGARNNLLREKFDFAISRAVAPLNVLAEYCLPYVKLSGKFVAMKGPEYEEDLKNAENAIKLLGGEVESINKVQLPDKSKRTIIIIKKIDLTNEKYPRKGTKISKKPL